MLVRGTGCRCQPLHGINEPACAPTTTVSAPNTQWLSPRRSRVLMSCPILSKITAWMRRCSLLLHRTGSCCRSTRMKARPTVNRVGETGWTALCLGQQGACPAPTENHTRERNTSRRAQDYRGSGALPSWETDRRQTIDMTAIQEDLGSTNKAHASMNNLHCRETASVRLL